MSRTLAIAAAQYPLDEVKTWGDYEAKITRWVDDAVAGGAELLVFPEYGGLELGALAGPEKAGDLRGVIDAMTERLDEADALHRDLARDRGVYIVAGSAQVWRDDGRAVNVARFFAPTGQSASYEKLMLTPWERNSWGLSAGTDLKVFDTPKGRIGLVICYDIEFPLLGRALAEAGAEVILAPSVTETERGYWRVRIGALARALENQIYTVQAPLIGSAPWCPPADESAGAAGIFAASDGDFPAGGIIATGKLNEPGWVHATIDLDLVATLRASGRVQTYRHWSEQPGAAPLPAVEVVRFGHEGAVEDAA